MVKIIVCGVEVVVGMEVLFCIVFNVFLDNLVLEVEILLQGDIYVILEDLVVCDGLILGFFICFGNMVVSLKYFLDSISVLWMKGVLINKLVVVFIFISSLYGGQEFIFLSMMLLLLYYGMVYVGLFYSEVVLIQI